MSLCLALLILQRVLPAVITIIGYAAMALFTLASTVILNLTPARK